MSDVTVTYYLEIVSSWCYWAEPAWAELKARYAGRVAFEWRIARMRPEDIPVSRAQCDWFYRRSGTMMGSPVMLNSGWLEPGRGGDYLAPDLVAEAGRDLGFTDDRLRLALSRAAEIEGRRIGDLAEAIAVAVAATGLDPAKLRARAESAEVNGACRRLHSRISRAPDQPAPRVRRRRTRLATRRSSPASSGPRPSPLRSRPCWLMLPATRRLPLISGARPTFDRPGKKRCQCRMPGGGRPHFDRSLRGKRSARA